MNGGPVINGNRHLVNSPGSRTKRGLVDPTDRIREAILGGRFFPNERLPEEELVRQFEANRGAVRLALARLEQEGLVIREPNRGARVRVVSEEEAIEIAEARVMIESFLARAAAAKATARDIAELRRFQRVLEGLAVEGKLLEFADTNIGFHAEIARIANHQTAQKLFAGLRSRGVILQFRPVMEPGRAAQVNDEHEILVNALAAHDAAAAEAAMRLHLDHAVTTLKNTIARQANAAGIVFE